MAYYVFVNKGILKFFLFVILFYFNSAKGSDLNIFSVGLFDFNKQKNEAVDIRFEKRFDKSVFNLGPEEAALYTLKPFFGIEATSDSALYGLVGVFIEEKITENIFITPNFGVGAFSKGDGKDLGHAIEFRSTIEFSVQLESGNRIGLSVGHISNSSIGEKNPGTEILSFSYQTPF